MMKMESGLHYAPLDRSDAEVDFFLALASP